MFTLHCTAKARKRLKITPTNDIPEPTTRLGNWYCHEIIVQRRKYLFFANENTLLPVIIPSAGLRSIDDILDLFKKYLIRNFLYTPLPKDKCSLELLEMADVVFAKTQSKENSQRVQDILTLYEDMKKQVVVLTHSQYGQHAVDFIFNKPFFRSTSFVRQESIPDATARRLLKELRDGHVIRPIREASGRRAAMYVFPKLLNIAEGRDVF